MFRRPADPSTSSLPGTPTDEWEPGAHHTPPSHTKSGSDPGAPLWMHSPGCRPEPLLVLQLSLPTKSRSVYGASDPFGASTRANGEDQTRSDGVELIGVAIEGVRGATRHDDDRTGVTSLVAASLASLFECRSRRRVPCRSRGSRVATLPVHPSGGTSIPTNDRVRLEGGLCNSDALGVECWQTSTAVQRSRRRLRSFPLLPRRRPSRLPRERASERCRPVPWLLSNRGS